MSPTATPVKVKADWDTQKRNQVTVEMIAGRMSAVMEVVHQASPEVQEKFKSAKRAERVKMLKNLGANSPYTLVQAMAEIDANVYGSEIEISGDDSKAQLTYINCAMWNAMQKENKFTQEQQEKMGKEMQACGAKVAEEFGLKSQYDFNNDRMTVTISR